MMLMVLLMGSGDGKDGGSMVLPLVDVAIVTPPDDAND